MTKPALSRDNTKLHLFAIVLVTIAFYSGTLGNFFYADDFIWLDRAKHLAGNWSSIFIIENRYFTPLTYLSFYLNYTIFGLNPFWYHLHDTLFHALNGCLLYLLACRISGDRRTAFIAALTFVTSAAILMTVLWPSARTDLMMVFFSLATMIAFGKGESPKQSLLPIFLYVLAVSAKGTALVLPVILFFLTAETKPFKARIIAIAPYLAVNAVYTGLLLLNKTLGGTVVEPSHKIISATNIVIAFPTLIVPERYLALVSTPVLLSCSFISLLIMLAVAFRSSNTTFRIGTALTVFGLIPLLFTRDYSLAGDRAHSLMLLASPSNRVYLASAGISLLYAVLLAPYMGRERRPPARIMAGTLLLVLLWSNYLGITAVNRTWHKGTERVRNNMTALEHSRALLTDHSSLLLFNFEGSTGFSRAMLRTFYDLDSFDVHAFDYRYTQEFTDVDRSPLYNSAYDQNPASIKLILHCPNNQAEEILNRNGNLFLQKVLSDYRYLQKASDPADIQAAQKRLHDNMVEIRTIMNFCSPPPSGL